MLPIWTGEVVGTMHIYGITKKQLAGKLGIDKAYLSGLLHAKRYVPSAESRIRNALSSMIEDKMTAKYEEY